MRIAAPFALRAAAAAAVLLFAAVRPQGAAAQVPGDTGAPAAAAASADTTVVFRGAAVPDVDDRIRGLLSHGGYLLVTRDTILQGDTIRRSVLVMDATVALDAPVRGSVVAVSSNVFVRPRADVAGDLVNAGGGLYRSALATVRGAVLDEPLADYRVEGTAASWTIVARPSAAVAGGFFLPGLQGLSIPTYDRVNGLRLGWGFGFRVPGAIRARPEVIARGLWFSDRGDFGGVASATATIGSVRWTAAVERDAFTNEAWARGPTHNSLSYLFLGHDYRDYYDADRIRFGGEGELDAGGVALTIHGRVQRESARSLQVGNAWSLFTDEEAQPNLPVDDGVVSSVVLGADAAWDTTGVKLLGGAELELAGRAAGGDFAFGAWNAWADWLVPTFRRQTLHVEAHLQGPLPGTDSLPRQRWSFVGGGATLYTFDRAEFRGDRVVYVKTTYTFPLPERLALPVLGAPDLDLLHVAGYAWTHDGPATLEQNVGVKLQFFVAFVRAVFDPTNLDDHKVSVGLSMPF